MVISDLDKDICIDLVMGIHEKTHFGRKVYCRPVIGMSPVKTRSATSSLTDSAANVEPVITSRLIVGDEQDSDSEDERREIREKKRREFLKSTTEDDFKTVGRSKRGRNSPGNTTEKPNNKKVKAGKKDTTKSTKH